MKKIITLLIIIVFSIIGYSQTDTLRIHTLEKNVEALNDSINKIKQDESSLFLLKEKIINDKLDYQKIDEKVDEKFNTFVTKYIELTIGLIALIVGLLTWIRGKTITEEKIREEVEEKISKITNIEKEFIAKNLNEYKKHINLKDSAEIIVLNENGTDFPEGFKNVLKLYKGYNEARNRIDLNGLHSVFDDEIIERLKNVDLVIIENQVEIDRKGNEKHWRIDIGYKCKTVQEIEENSIKGTQEERQAYQNNLHLIELSNLICDSTAIIYYGQSGKGNFPSNFVEEEKQHMITFANAPSQLYSNILNMLKFKSEIES